ncbi:hypothetical protein GGS26DRAFT_588310 [Hypomontagnella submonticulosa]|nr:hypothetical protein GGS26DRAFT_588310 [Hypomontagnella submonticulosa]
MFHGVYNLEVRKRLERKGVKVTSIGIVSKLIADQWDRLPEGQKKFFETVAAEESRLHAAAHPWYSYVPGAERVGSKASLADTDIPGYLDMEKISRNYHAMVRANRLPVFQPVPQGDERNLAQYNCPDLYFEILTDPSETRTKRARGASYNMRKALRTRARQSPGGSQSASAASSSSAAIPMPARQVPPAMTGQNQRVRVVASPAVINRQSPQQPHIEQHHERVENENPQPQLQQAPQLPNGQQQLGSGSAEGALDLSYLGNVLASGQFVEDFNVPLDLSDFGGQPSAPPRDDSSAAPPPATAPDAQEQASIQPGPAHDGGAADAGAGMDFDLENFVDLDGFVQQEQQQPQQAAFLQDDEIAAIYQGQAAVPTQQADEAPLQGLENEADSAAPAETGKVDEVDASEETQEDLGPLGEDEGLFGDDDSDDEPERAKQQQSQQNRLTLPTKPFGGLTFPK